jgi:hypothetical protein
MGLHNEEFRGCMSHRSPTIVRLRFSRCEDKKCMQNFNGELS